MFQPHFSFFKKRCTRFHCLCFSFSPSLLCHLPQRRALAAEEQLSRIVHCSFHFSRDFRLVSTSASATSTASAQHYCFCFSFNPLFCHLPQIRALAAGEQPDQIKVHWSSAEISCMVSTSASASTSATTVSASVSARAYFAICLRVVHLLRGSSLVG